MQRAIQEHSTYDVIHRTIAPDGQIRWIRAIGTVSYDDANEPIRFDGITVNVTDQKQQEEERDRLLYREQIARHLAELNIRRVSQLQELTAALAQVMTKADGIKVLLERGLAALDARRGWVAERSPDTTNRVEMVGVLGYQEDEIALSERIPLTESLPVTDAIRTGQMIIVRSPQDYRERYPTLAERFILTGTQSLVAVPLMVDDHPIGAVGLSFPIPRDFSQEDCAFLLTLAQQCAQALERARLYEAEREAREAAEAASRFKDDFLAILSHELRSPLNPILGWSRLLQLRKFDELTAKRALQTIERNARLQAQLIEDLLDVSRILQGQLNLNISSVDLVKMIETSMESARLAADAKSIDLCFAIEDSDLKNADRTTNSLELVNTDSSKLTTQSSKFQVAGDATRIQQIMWNLVSNAVKFTQPGGQVAIKLSLVSGHSSDAEETNGTQEKGKPDHYARIQVSDTGKGIHSDFLPYVFDSFRQADSTITRRFGGLGMGLAIVRHLVELHGGLVQAESLGEGRGSTFTVWLPLLKDEGVRMKGEWEPQSSTFSSLPLKGIRVLVVDDESDIRDFAAFVLEQFGAEPIVVASAAEALQALAKFQFDILLSDIGMPKVDGYGLMCQIRKLPADRGGKIPAIALTAYAGEFNQRKALSSGFQLHMSKPVEPEALIAAISRLVRK
ncbi:MAG: response regulator [Cyanobacteria bacterium CRU_2_1]|nr:response regulator [Cyanobacteria bacterium CRU_2_1]